MPTLSLTTKAPATVKADALVVAVASAPNGPRLLGEALPAPLRRSLAGSLAGLGVSGAADEVVRVPSGGGVAAPVVVLTGVGTVGGRGDAVTPEALRRAAGAATRTLAGVKAVAVALPTADVAALAAVAEGALLGAYTFTRYRTAKDAKQAVAAVTVVSDLARGAAAKAAATRAEVLAAAVAGTRDLINTPPLDLYPAAFADEATKAVEGLGVKVTVLDEKKLARGGYGGLLGVGMGSSRPPRLVRLDYAPAGATAHVALVGKGITFDSGGLSIKPAAGMEAMKSDMSGAAAVLHTVVAAARLGLKVTITGWLALAENMPSGTAQRPSDVITIYGGKTVEVLNTDAEGRLVLADALVAASETNPDVIVDVATLTGAQMVALGNRTSAIMANDDAFRERLHSLSAAAGEQFWPMPLPAELRASMDSPVADIANMGERFGGMLVAGLFLAEFVGTRPGAGDAAATQIPWAHLDIAGPAFNTGKAFGYTPVGGTGVAVRTLLALAEDVAASGV
ncbi:leucyl aminopeptidase [Kineosporia sp. A_224]|uniref:leucyl aminopeptidase n=1 Tax=Kineosporia sp. A_224 TaxID=1962180 RepID=UPI000B4BD749|nr:leucyl aminopeptidase [Kineosporia sp. A_224]